MNKHIYANIKQGQIGKLLAPLFVLRLAVSGELQGTESFVVGLKAKCSC